MFHFGNIAFVRAYLFGQLLLCHFGGLAAVGQHLSVVLLPNLLYCLVAAFAAYRPGYVLYQDYFLFDEKQEYMCLQVADYDEFFW